MSRRLFEAAAPWDDLRANFRWPEYESFNIATACCDDWASEDPNRPALIHPQAEGPSRVYSFAEVRRLSTKFANVLTADGFAPGARCAVLLPQAPETLFTHFATYRAGGIVVPLFTLFGEDGLSFRLQDSAAEVLVTDSANLPKILAIRDSLPDLKSIFCIDGAVEEIDGVRDFWAATLAARDGFTTVATGPDTPALISYTSGTTGPPKGALHGHRVLLGHLPGVETHHDFFPQPDDLMWTPADWAWMGGLFDALLPSLYYGVPVLAHRMAKFDPDAAFELMAREGVRNAFLPPTALKFLRRATPPEGLALRSVGSGGEALGADLLSWGKEALGLTINEFYGSTECNLVLGNAASVMEPKPGSTGRAVPGKDVAILSPEGDVLPAGEIGEIAVRKGDPAMFLGYWNRPEKTAEKFSGNWLLMGDEGYMDEDGFVFFSARTDDVINTSGYRVGPSEIEACLTGDPRVTMAAAIGVPDAEKGEVIKAFVVLRDAALDDALTIELIDRVRTRISPHVAPRQIVAVDGLPMTATGKIMRRALKE